MKPKPGKKDQPHDFELKEFKTFSMMKYWADLFEVAQVMENNMALGRVAIPTNKIKFEPLKGSYPYKLLNSLSQYITPQYKETKLGQILIMDNYAIRFKK